MEVLVKIMQILSHLKMKKDALTITALKSLLNSDEPILSLLLWLEEFGFIHKISKSDDLESKWKITAQGKKFLQFLNKFKILQDLERVFEENNIIPIFVLPRKILDKSESMFRPLHDILFDYFSSIKNELLISSPYIDQTIEPFLSVVPNISNMNIKIISDNESEKYLKRLAARWPNIEYRTLEKYEDNVRIYMVHAKYICIDNNITIVGSFNFNERSLFHNFEAGVVIKSCYITGIFKNFFYFMFKCG